MTEEKNDMFSRDPHKTENKTLLEYLNGSLSETERKQFEEQVPDDPFLKDAIEGLHTVNDKDGLPKLVNHLNQQLHHHLAQSKVRKGRRSFQFDSWIYWSILVVLLLAVAAFLVLRLMMHR